jgi:coenzyme PQQ biosynthesis protein PqqD
VTAFDPKRPRLAPFARYRWDRIREQHQVVYPEGVLVLNPTGAEVVQRMDGRTLDELVAALETAFSAQGLRADVLVFLQRLFDHGLLKRDDDT